MVELSKPIHNKKGILLFKHMEINVLLGLKHQSKQYLEALKDSYYIGLYFGYITHYNLNLDFIDFVVSEKGSINNYNQIGLPIVHLSGNCFLNEDIHEQFRVDRPFDLLGIFNSKIHKRVNDFLEISEALNSKRKREILLITYGSKDDFKRLEQEVNQFDNNSLPEILWVESIGKNKKYPLSNAFICRMISMSKAVLLTSKKEGASRFIAEGFSLGCQVFLNADLEGGTADKLRSHPENFKEYHSLDEGVTLIDDFLLNYSSQNLKTKDDFLASKNLDVFKSFLSQNFHSINLDFVAFEESFSFVIPSHINVIPEKYSNSVDDRILYTQQLIKYFGILTNDKLKPKIPLKVYFHDLSIQTLITIKKVYSKLLFFQKLIK